MTSDDGKSFNEVLGGVMGFDLKREEERVMREKQWRESERRVREAATGIKPLTASELLNSMLDDGDKVAKLVDIRANPEQPNEPGRPSVPSRVPPPPRR